MNHDTISRKKFLQQAGTAGAAALASPLLGKANFIADKKIRVAVIGCGSVSHRYLPHLATCPYAELVSTCDIIPQRAIDAAKEHNIPNHYPHIDKLLTGAPFDLMITLTDMQVHEELNRKAILAGKHVWSEKPMANTYKAGKELLDLAKQKGVRIWGAPAVVNSPQFAYMSQEIQKGTLGNVSAATAHYGHLGPTWSAFFYEQGGGSMPDLGVYNIASLTGLLGPAKSVIAMTSIVTHDRIVDNKGAIKVQAEDNAMIVMEHANGTLSHVQCGFNYFDPYGHEAKGQDRPSIIIWGTKGNMSLIGYDWEPFGVEVAVSYDQKPVRYATDAGTYVWQQGASVICEALATGKEPLINAEHALHVLEVIEAARISQATGKRVQMQSVFPWPVVKV